MLDYYNFPFDEHSYVPFLHMYGIKKLLSSFNKKGVATATTSSSSTPVLATYDSSGNKQTAIQDSEAIGLWLSDRYCTTNEQATWTLYGPVDKISHTVDRNADKYKEIVALEQRFGKTIGPATRIVAYHAVLPLFSSWVPMMTKNFGWAQAVFGILFYPVIRLLLTLVFKLSDKRVALARNRLEKEFDEVDNLLKDGRPFLCGDRLTAADISFASLASIVVGITHKDGYGAWMPSLDKFSQQHIQWANAMRARPSGQLILRLFKDNRHRQTPVALPAAARL
jgi:hypothetical protein